jgi:outer membrane lipoprotein SlyB
VPATPAPDATTPPPATTVAQAPAQAPIERTAPAHAAATHHTTHSTTGSGTGVRSSGGNTTVADAGNGTNAAPAYSEPARPAAPPVCTTCGTIDSYDAVKVQGQTNGIGAVGGGAVGAVVGSQIAGRHNHTLGGVIGAIGGGLLGNEIEKSQRTTTVYDVHVRMDDGSMRTIRQSSVPVVGQKVTVEGNTLHGRSSSQSTGYSNGGSNYQAAPSGNGGSSFSPSGN